MTLVDARHIGDLLRLFRAYAGGSRGLQGGLSTRFRKYGNVSITRPKTAPFSRGSVCGLILSRDRRKRSARNTRPYL